MRAFKYNPIAELKLRFESLCVCPLPPLAALSRHYAEENVIKSFVPLAKTRKTGFPDVLLVSGRFTSFQAAYAHWLPRISMKNEVL